MGGTVQIEFTSGFPAVINSKAETENIIKISEKIVGKDNVVKNYKTMCSEDFSFFLNEKPGAYIFIGNKGENKAPQHSEDYIVSEKAILIGVQVLYEIVKKYLFNIK